MWPWRKKKEPEIVFLDGGKEPDYNRVRQLTQEEIDRHRIALEHTRTRLACMKRDMLELDYETWRKKYGIMEQDELDALFGLKKKEKEMNDINLTNVKLKKDKCGYYLRLKYIQETDSVVNEIIIPKYRLPIRTNDLIIRNEGYHGTSIEADIGFGYFPLENGVTEHSDGKEVIFTVKELKKKVHKMTVADIEKKLGYKIEIVSEESEG